MTAVPPDAVFTLPADGQAVGILLAAGFGRRFAAADGRHAPGSFPDKLLGNLPDGRAVAEAAAENLLAAVPCVLAITRPGQAALAARLRAAGCTVLASPAAEHGMGASLAAGAAAVLAASSGRPPPRCVIALADMPWIAPATLTALLAAAPGHAIAAPVHHGRRGHPVVFDGALLHELAMLDGDTGARALLSRHPVHLHHCDDGGVLRDVDLPADLRQDRVAGA